ncbi:NUDIX hydrolase [Lichenihabitans sp. Uapishka_5]|uniref:NUDIX hydrolase n=1 Tax=Lichenihabitans sp. Uapishka_5 TaxID=3037302 RepID=UPI0029E7DD6F|nr:NUDIX hydrolase [Lichenihabitans sp. Uapishka_5]MDX7951092.1 NUDIX hydrolase [Lichenihabitans sp. Uapishka_5]
MKKLRAPGQVEQVRQQYAALPFRRGDGLEIMLITSRETRRWVVPKGWPMKGRRPRGTAAREAMEEAGISGAVAKAAIGSYVYIKRGIGGKSWPCRVDVFPLEVRVERATWRERKQRTRQWFNYIEAADAVAEPDLKGLILAFGVAFDRMDG